MNEENKETPHGDHDPTLTYLDTGDDYKQQTQNQWNNDPCGSHYVKEAAAHTLEWYLEVERYRYDEYGPWMPEVMEFAKHRGHRLLEIGAGMGTDHAQFAKNGALVTDIDLSLGHLEHAKENFRLRGLEGNFVHHDAETLPFDDNTFDVVYSNGVLHHTPNTGVVIDEIYRVLKPGGKVIAMFYAEHSLLYWRNFIYHLGVKDGLLADCSVHEIMSRHAEISERGAKPLVKVYTARRLKKMFSAFGDVSIVKRQMVPDERIGLLRFIPVSVLERLIGWNLIIKGYK